MGKVESNDQNATGPAKSPEKGGRLTGKRQKAAFLVRELDRLFPDPPMPLDHRDAYTLLVAVLLSAQCTDKRVNEVTPALFALADTPGAMAGLPEAQILGVIRPCGLGPQKARAIRRLSEIIAQQHGGRVPEDPEALEALPGVGHKTAQVVLAQAFGKPAFPVDTHIHRLAQRWGLTSGQSVQQTERDLKRLFPESVWNRLHLQIIFFGRAQCTARTPCDGGSRSCAFCPLMNGVRQRPRTTRKA